MEKGFFEGWYFKQQVAGETVAFIVGQADSGAFVQMITDERSYHFGFPALYKDKKIVIGGCVFGADGAVIELPDIHGELKFGELTPLRSDIMGPFRFLPMQCRHGVISMRHTVAGKLQIGERCMSFDGGVGYIEKDSGRSFPKEYIWLQCNNFAAECSVMVSVAHIPFVAFSFTGCICAVTYAGLEYRFSTYQGVKILRADSEQIYLSQGKYQLKIDIIKKGNAHALASPLCGKMLGVVREDNSAKARFKLIKNGRVLFDLTSENVSFECVPRQCQFGK